MKRIYLIIPLLLIIVFIGLMKTTITIQKETRDSLASLGTKDSTFDEIIQNLIDRTRGYE